MTNYLLLHCRLAAGLSQEEVAAGAAVPLHHLQAYEAAQTFVSARHAERLAAFLNIDPLHLCTHAAQLEILRLWKEASWRQPHKIDSLEQALDEARRQLRKMSDKVELRG